MAQGTYESQRVVKTKYPGIFATGNNFQVRYRHHGKLAQRSFRTLSEARRFKGKVDAVEAQPTSRQPFKTYGAEWIDNYQGRTSEGVSETTRGLPGHAEALRHPVLRHPAAGPDWTQAGP